MGRSGCVPASDSSTNSLASLALPYQLTGAGGIAEVSASGWSETPKMADDDANTSCPTATRARAVRTAIVVMRVSPKSRLASATPAEMSLLAARW